MVLKEVDTLRSVHWSCQDPFVARRLCSVQIEQSECRGLQAFQPHYLVRIKLSIHLTTTPAPSYRVARELKIELDTNSNSTPLSNGSRKFP